MSLILNKAYCAKQSCSMHACVCVIAVCLCVSVCLHPVNIIPLHILLGLSSGQYHLSTVQCLLVTQHCRQRKCNTDNQLDVSAFGLGLRPNTTTDFGQSVSSVLRLAPSPCRAVRELFFPLWIEARWKCWKPQTRAHKQIGHAVQNTFFWL